MIMATTPVIINQRSVIKPLSNRLMASQRWIGVSAKKIAFNHAVITGAVIIIKFPKAPHLEISRKIGAQ